MNGNDGVNIADVRTIVRQCAASFLTETSAKELAELVADAIDGMDVLELSDEGESWELVSSHDDVSLAIERYERFGQYAA